MTDVIRIGKKSFTIALAVAVVMWSLGMALVAPVRAAEVGDLIKMDGLSTVYYLGLNGSGDKSRYVFPNEHTYLSWYADFSGVVTVSQAELESYPLAKNVTVRPGTKLVKITTDPKVYAVEPGGVLRHVDSEARAITLYGANWAHRVIDVADSFFTNYTIGSAINTDAYPTGSLVTYEGDPNVYYVDSSSKRLIADEASFLVNRFMWDNVLTAPAAITLADGADVVGAEGDLVDTASGAGGNPAAGSDLTVALSSSTAVAQTYLRDTGALAAQAMADFATFNFTAGSDGDVSVDTLRLTRSGISADTDLGSIYLYDHNGMRLAENVSFSSKVVTFYSAAGLFTVPAGTTKPVHVKADIAPLNATVSSIILGINAASDVVTDGASVSGTFPMNGNPMAVATVADLGYLNLQAAASTTWPATIDPGLMDQELWKFQATATDQTMEIEKINITMVGTISHSDLENFYLSVAGTPITDVIPSMNSSKEILFDLSDSPYVITKGQNKHISLHGDIVSGSNRAFKPTLRAVSDLITKDNEYGVYVRPLIAGAAFSLYDPDTAGDGTNINAGTLTVSLNADSPTGNVASAALNVPLAKFDVKATGEDVKITTMAIKMTELADGANGTNGALYLDGVQVGATDAEVIDLATVLFTMNQVIQAGQTKTFEYRMDIVSSETTGGQTAGTGYTANQTLKAEIVGASCAAQGMSSLATVNVSSAAGKTLTVKTGALSVAKNTSMFDYTALIPTGVPGTTNVKVGSFTLTAGAGEAVQVTQIVVGDDLGVPTSDFGDSFQNLKLMNGDTQLAPTQGTLSGTAGADYTFNLSPAITIAAGAQYVVDAYADILSGIVAGTAGNYATAEVGLEFVSAVATGVNTGSDATGALGTPDLQNIYIADKGGLVIGANASTPKANQLVMGETDVIFMVLDLEASNTEDLQITRIEISETSGDFNSSLKNIKLTDGTNPIGSTIASFDASDDAEFVLAEPWIIPAGTSKQLYVKASVNQYPQATSGGTATLALSTNADIDTIGADSGEGITETVVAATGNAMDWYRTKITAALGPVSPSGTQTAGANATLLEFKLAAASNYSAILNDLDIYISGNMNTSSTGNAVLYDKADLSTALSTEAYTTKTASAAGTTSTLIAATAITGIPIGANVRVYDASTTAYMTTGTHEVVSIGETTVAGDTMTVTPVMSADTAVGDIVYYRPAQPGSGELYFGARTALGADVANNAVALTVASTDGFAIGDTVVVKGYSAVGAEVTSSAGGVIANITSGTAMAISAITVAATIDYDYLSGTAANAIAKGHNSTAVAYTGAINSVITAGTEKTYVVKGDSSGATSTQTLRLDITSAGDLGWSDYLMYNITSKTQTFPIIGGTLSY